MTTISTTRKDMLGLLRLSHPQFSTFAVEWCFALKNRVTGSVFQILGSLIRNLKSELYNSVFFFAVVLSSISGRRRYIRTWGWPSKKCNIAVNLAETKFYEVGPAPPYLLWVLQTLNLPNPRVIVWCLALKCALERPTLFSEISLFWATLNTKRGAIWASFKLVWNLKDQ